MPSNKPLIVFVASIAITPRMLAASKEKVLYSFCSANNYADGVGPSAGGVVGE
jgi:hypothetical protein